MACDRRSPPTATAAEGEEAEAVRKPVAGAVS